MTAPASDPAAGAVAGVALLPPVPAADQPARAGRLHDLEVWAPAGFLLLLVLACFLLPVVAPVPAPVGGSVLDSNLPVGSAGHWLGTNAAGNDVLSRVLYGGRVSLEVAAATQLIGLVVGGLLGMLAGYDRGVLSAVLTRVFDVFIAFPSLVLALAIAEGLGPSELHTIWALCFFSVPAFARVARAATLQLRDRTFMVAGRLIGVPRWRMLLLHVSPNIAPQLITFGLLGAGVAIILEGALSFLSLGVPPPGASWGNMIAEGQQVLSAQPYLVLVPSAALLLTVAAFNLLGDGLRRRWSAR